MRLLLIAFGLLLIVAAAAPANASAFTYDEATATDLEAVLPAPTVFLLGVGANTVTGTQISSLAGFDLDSFAFTIPAGTVLSSITYAFASNSTLNSDNTVYVLDNGNATAANPVIASLTSHPHTDTSPVVFAGTPLGPGTYGMTNLSTGHGALPWTLSYTWTLQVDEAAAPIPTPEPTSILLFGSGVATLIAKRSRRWRS